MSLRSYRRIRQTGKRAFGPPERPLPPGRCTWCGVWTLELDRDHVLPRDLFPGPHRDDPPNLVPACRQCNHDRADGNLRPSFLSMPKRTQAFVLSWWRIARLRRHFTDVPDEPRSGTEVTEPYGK